MPFAAAAGRRIEYEWIGEPAQGVPALVFLHEGLGSIRQWREFPLQVFKSTGCAALVYNRYGYGASDVLAEPTRSVRFMHEEALESLPQLLSNLGIEAPILVGHSDGASIALIHAGAGHAVRGLALMAPHVFVEEHGLAGIREAKRAFETGDLRERLAKYHRDVAKTFRGWNDVWLSDGFRAWNIEEYLPGVRCPVLAIQGEDDAYGTMAQVEAIRRKVSGPCEAVKLPACGHAPHREQPDATLAAVSRFVKALP
ncbi:MAG: alpha/beta hydrolase [Betaproteobacteria bacterium RIFCSPHIGHO2_12_FULL_69_13]|nr:MAG: alpha/beta hydrolase [Betaproteobacteria bacterium RIFCSPHIGHO2_12_FULL_69_13]